VRVYDCGMKYILPWLITNKPELNDLHMDAPSMRTIPGLVLIALTVSSLVAISTKFNNSTN